MIHFAIRRLIESRYLVLGLSLCVWLAIEATVPRLDFDRSIERFFPVESPQAQDYQHLKRWFGGNEIVLAVYDDPALLSKDGEGLRRVASVSRRLESVEGVAGVLSLDRPLGEEILDDELARARRVRRLFEGMTHGADGRTVAISCLLDTSSARPRREVLGELRSVMASLPDQLAPGYLTGEPVMVSDGFDLIARDGSRLGRWSTWLLGGTIAICFRRLRWVVIPIAVVQLALALTRLVAYWSGLQLTMVSSMLEAIITVVGVATVIHIIVRYRQARDRGMGPHEALQNAGEWLAAPITWAIITDAVGFAALTVADVVPVRDFGVLMAIGSLAVLVSVPCLVPGLILLGATGESWDGTDWNWLRSCLRQSIPVIRRRRRTLTTTILVTATLAIYGTHFLEVESDFTKNFRAGSRLVEAYDIVETRLGGAGVCDIVLPAPKRLGWEFLNRVRRLENELATLLEQPAERSRPGITKVISLDDAIRAGLDTPLTAIADNVINRIKLRAAEAQMRSRLPAFFNAIYVAEGEVGWYRIMVRAREQQTADAKRVLIEQIETIVHRHFPEGTVTGFFVLLARMIESLLHDQWITFGWAILGIFLTMSLALRDGRLALIALVPNIVPVVCVTGMLGWMHATILPELRVNMGAVMIAAVSLGLSIDSSIHYLVSFRRQMISGVAVPDILATAQCNVGQAMMLSSLALVIGFTLLCTSEFIPTVYFGALVSISILGGLVGNLLILPLLLSLAFDKSLSDGLGTTSARPCVSEL